LSFTIHIVCGSFLEAPWAERARDDGEVAMLKKIIEFTRNNSGATAIEYGLIAASIAVVIITAVKSIGTKTSGTFAKVSGNLA
jgi:pilus assembly protein Flp/PilA